MAESDKILGMTGSFGYIGKRLIRRLCDDTAFKKIICTDILPPPEAPPEKFEVHRCDIRDRERLSAVLREGAVDTLIHLAFIANPTRDPGFEYDVDVNGTRNVLHACKSLKIRKLVVASSDCAYGFFEGTPDYLSESAPVRSTPGFPYSENKAAIEQLLADFIADTPECAVVILRPCIVMGPNANNTTSKSMKDPVIIGVRGYDPIMQFIHEDDAAEAFYLAAVRDVQGVFNLAADGGLRYSELARVLGKPMISLPVWLIYPLVELLYRLRVVPFGRAQLDYIRYPLSMDVEKIGRVMGFKPKYTTRETLRTLLPDP
ncbi:MAG: NAD-dependent epimerase/dehydratase family protein [Syntrophales bacterium]|jgi:UDP-glucose 4-epimerase|nr:NAD-dependent epimerase/dehydratase family protein [Syntrophales bacterium]HOG18751.1 NAD-dependent epimerase/dehydratase family protein [Syntrophales bacterium]HQN26690.1 NAD-dependent epimerase/dehydratase family protein [Syntrophales bacterium]HQP29362.1 NAD-dependent epimerase/dehydratase family protein [Syntrophales bacterium]